MEHWKAFRLYTAFNFSYLCFLIGYVVLHFHYGSLYDLVLFYFEAPHSDFIVWFPRYHTWLFIAVIGLKALGICTTAALLWVIMRYHQRISRFFWYNGNNGYVQFIRAEGIILLVALAYYITVYVLTRITLEGVIYNDVQVLVARGVLFHFALQIATILLSHRSRVIVYFRSFLLAPQLPYNIALLRILFFSYLAFLYFGKWHSAFDIIKLERRVALPSIGWLIDIIPISPNIYSWMVALGIGACAMVVIGYRTRIFLILNALICFYIFATPNFFGKLWHEQLVIWITWLFALSKCYDVLSWDARKMDNSTIISADYTFPIRLIWLQLGVIYFWAGFYKLWDSGFDWALGKSMINQVQLEWLQHYDQAPSLRIDQWPILLHIGGMAAILFELSYILIILRPQLRWLAAIAGLAMHNIIGYFMYISFSMVLQAFYVFYINFNPLFQKRGNDLVALVAKSYGKLPFSLGLLLVGINFCYGMFSIDSYPFSGYPKYSELIPDSIYLIRWEAHYPNGKVLDAHHIGKSNGFQWEDYGWLEHNLIRDHLEGINVDKRVQDYWKIWISRNPQIQNYTVVIPRIVKRAVAPEGRNNLVFVDSLHPIYP